MSIVHEPIKAQIRYQPPPILKQNETENTKVKREPLMYVTPRFEAVTATQNCTRDLCVSHPNLRTSGARKINVMPAIFLKYYLNKENEKKHKSVVLFYMAVP